MALALSVALDRTNARPSAPTRATLAAEIVAVAPPREGARLAQTTVLAIDVSASMRGEPLAHVIRSVDRLLDALGPEDRVGVVAFSDEATVVVEPIAVDDAGKRLVRSRVARLEVLDRTNIEAALELGARLLAGGEAPRRGVVLLSDGAPNVGAHTADALRDVARRLRGGGSFFALGYGPDHAEDVLAAVGEGGGGGYEYVPDPAVCARAFARALGAQGDVVAAAIELVVAPAQGVELVRFVGTEHVRFTRDGVVVGLADLVSGARRWVVAELELAAPGDRFLVEVAEVSLRWRDGGPLVRSIALEIADREPQPVGATAESVLLALADEARSQARDLADRGQFGAAATRLRGVLRQIEALPSFASAGRGPLADAYALVVDEATAFEQRPSPEAYAELRKAVVASKVSAPLPTSARSRGAMSQKLIGELAGDCPAAWLVRIDDGGGGARHRLTDEIVIGRTPEADLVIPSHRVARRHAEVFADAGAYYVADVSPTSPTYVNDERLGRSPHRLSPGDVIAIGEARLRYEE